MIPAPRKHMCAWLHVQADDPHHTLHFVDVLSTANASPFLPHLAPDIIANLKCMLCKVLPQPLPSSSRQFVCGVCCPCYVYCWHPHSASSQVRRCFCT